MAGEKSYKSATLALDNATVASRALRVSWRISETPPSIDEANLTSVYHAFDRQ